MSRVKSLNSILLVSASLAVSILAVACSTHREHAGDGGVWFVHATDPHMYLYLKKPDDEKEKAIWDYQQKQDTETFKTFLQALTTLPQKDGPPAFLLITGDFGVDPCLNLKVAAPPTTQATTPADAKGCLAAVDDKERASRVSTLADLLSASPIPDIYFVAGNNDLPFETADDAGLGYFNQFFQDVQSKITAKSANVRLHNLTGCYGPNAGAISNCSPDIPGTPYRMIGFPSQSFKNKDTKYASNQALQPAQYKTFRGFFDQAAKESKKVIIATHIPEMDDPYFLARDRYAGVKPDPSADTDKDNPRSAYSTWNVEKSLLDDWTKVLASDSLVAVLAGHLHDDHKEIYQRPYSWSTLKEHQLGYHKLFLAPPLSVKNQDGSPIQARGFSVVFLKDDHLSNRFYWFDGKTSAFTSDTSLGSEHPSNRHLSLLSRVFGLLRWLWDLDQSDKALERFCILLVALLAAFLTVIAISQIPPTDNPAAKKPDADKDKPAPDPSPFTNRFGKTILGGLSGLVFADLAKSLTGKQMADDAKCFYVVWFILFFLFLLPFWSAIRSLAEAVRSRVAVIHYPLARRPHLLHTLKRMEKESEETFRIRQWVVDWLWRIAEWLSYWVMRIINWFFSLKVPALTFFDTFINLVQGKNQTGTAFSEAVIDQQRNAVRVADTIRRKLHSLLQAKLNEIDVKEGKPLAQRHVRVNISVLSKDQSSVFYISRTPGSALLPFTKISVAWVSVFTGKIRWYESGYRKRNIQLFDNSDKTIPDGPKDIMLDNYYEERQDDYEAFIVIPVPQPQRAFGSNYVKGAIHISFNSKDDFRRIWNASAVNIPSAIPTPLPQPAPIVPYPQPEDMLGSWCSDDSIRTMLSDAVAVLGELLRGFNEIIYKSYIEPNQTD